MLKRNMQSTLNAQQLIEAAYISNASDIHIEPRQQHYDTKIRQQGEIQHQGCISFKTGKQIINQIKILAQCDTTQCRQPQDGRIQDIYNLPLVIRVNFLPMLLGERCVMRLLKTDETNYQLKHLNLTSSYLALLEQHVLRKQGMILITGPTGSGKTSTLYCILNHLKQFQKNILTIEDPIEMMLPHVNQTCVDESLLLSSDKLLRTMLRQDPDIIIIGEIRDHKMLKTAIDAANTGHLVIATIHSYHALDVIGRLKQLGMSRFHLAYTLSLIIAQQLVYSVCKRCRLYAVSINQKCTVCAKMPKKRVAVIEMLDISPAIKKALLQDVDQATLQRLASLSGFKSIRDKIIDVLDPQHAITQ